jgi:NADH-quinone oxidoreductase subunit N
VTLLGVFLLSLLGIPPLVGFMAKFQIFAAVFHAGQTAPTAWLSNVYYALLVIGGINTALSAVYYVRVLKVMILDKSLDEVEGRVPVPVCIPGLATAYAGFLAAVVIGLGVAWNFLTVASTEGVRTFAREMPLPPAAPKVAARGGA